MLPDFDHVCVSILPRDSPFLLFSRTKVVYPYYQAYPCYKCMTKRSSSPHLESQLHHLVWFEHQPSSPGPSLKRAFSVLSMRCSRASSDTLLHYQPARESESFCSGASGLDLSIDSVLVKAWPFAIKLAFNSESLICPPKPSFTKLLTTDNPSVHD